jgi:hypothetical protein
MKKIILCFILVQSHLLDAPAATIIPYKPKYYFDQTMTCCTREYDTCMANCTKGHNYCDRYCDRHRYKCVDTTYDCIDTCFVEEEYCLISTQGWVDNFFNTREIRCKRIKDNCLRTYCNITPL